jgi:hypothetical protein
MGRSPKSLAELELSGTMRRNPGRIRARLQEIEESASTAGPLGPAPSFLSPKEVTAWNELAALPPVTCNHAHIVELASGLIAKKRNGRLNRGELSTLLACLRALCLTPADRAKIGKKQLQKKPENPFQRIARQVRQQQTRRIN